MRADHREFVQRPQLPADESGDVLWLPESTRTESTPKPTPTQGGIMNATTYAVANPLAETIEDAENIIDEMRDAAEELNRAIGFVNEAQRRFKSAQDAYDAAELEETSEVVLMAVNKEGPLAGLATSSKAYDIALNKLKLDLRKGALLHLYADVDMYQTALRRAQMELEQAQTRFTALRKICELKTASLRAASI